MTGVGGAVEIRLVARVAIGGQRCVVVVHVALRARHAHVRARQRESRLRVVERRRAPAAGRMALRAVGGESTRQVIRIGGRCEVTFVAAVAIRGRVHVLVIDVALHTGKAGMHAGQRITGVRRMIEPGIEPIRCRVAHAAIVRQIRLRMRWISGPGKVRLVTREASRRRALELVIHVAGCAFQRGVHARKRISGYRQMVELGAEPAVHGVARIAGPRKR